MKSLSFFFLIIGTILLTVGYMNKKNEKENMIQNKIEYRFIPQSIYEEQMAYKDLIKLNESMFNTSINLDNYNIF